MPSWARPSRRRMRHATVAEFRPPFGHKRAAKVPSAARDVLRVREATAVCGIGAILSLDNRRVHGLESKLALMNDLMQHRGPDGEASGCTTREPRRLLATAGWHHRPRAPATSRWRDERRRLDHLQRRGLQLPRAARASSARTTSGPARDTEVVLRAYVASGARLRSSACAACSPSRSGTRPSAELFCARDRFGIKPFYYAVVDGRLLLRLRGEGAAAVPARDRDRPRRPQGLPRPSSSAWPARRCSRASRAAAGPHAARSGDGVVDPQRYWEVYYDVDFDHTRGYFDERSSRSCWRSRSAPPAQRRAGRRLPLRRPRFEHRRLARRAREQRRLPGLHRQVLRGRRATTRAATRGSSPTQRGLRPARDRHRRRGLPRRTSPSVIYHLDYPVAGPGLVPAVHGLRSSPREHVKVVLGGQGGDEIFGGYARYLIAYFEQCIKAAIEGTMQDGNFVVTYESIIPNLVDAARTTSRCCRSSGARACSRTSTRATSA